MAARPLPPPDPEPTRKKTTPAKQPFLEMIRSVSDRPAIQERLHSVMKKRWLRVAGIVFACFLLLMILLPLFINVNSFRPKIESEATNALGRQVKLGDLRRQVRWGPKSS